jgi:hypothetical protein
MRIHQLRTLIVFFIVLVFQFKASAQQSLYMPIEYKQAYENGTRLWNGNVSEKYRQNSANYDLHAKVNPKTRVVDCSGTIVYSNNQDQELSYVVFQAYKDLYPSGMRIKSLRVGGETYSLDDEKRVKHLETYYRLVLGKPLQPNESLTIEMEWAFTIPEKVDRDGAYDASSMLVAYWYPEMAVYDDVFGWDEIVFDGDAEFYHDVSNFKVEVEIPSKYVVWASAEPKNSEEIYPKSMLDRISLAKQSAEKVIIIGSDDLAKGVKMNSTIWKYEVDSFPDFTFAFSDHFIWEANTYQDQNGKYFLNSVYPEKNVAFGDVLKIENEALYSYHNEFPLYPFPFKHFVAFNGENAGGMEFAGMCNNQMRTNYKAEGISYSDYEANKLLAFHEMMHMYFPFLMGINEKRYAWMDEGMAEFSEDFFTNVSLESYKDRSRFARSSNPPLMVETYSIPKTYGIVSYDIASQSYHALYQLLGAELFTKCMNGYMDRWKYKHPTPYDFMFTFNDLSGKNLDWFWKAWYFDWGYPDVAVGKYENGILEIENVGGRPIAVEVVIEYGDKRKESRMLSPEVWHDSNLHKLVLAYANDVVAIELKTLNGADAVGDNNFWRQ